MKIWKSKFYNLWCFSSNQQAICKNQQSVGCATLCSSSVLMLITLYDAEVGEGKAEKPHWSTNNFWFSCGIFYIFFISLLVSNSSCLHHWSMKMFANSSIEYKEQLCKKSSVKVLFSLIKQILLWIKVIWNYLVVFIFTIFFNIYSFSIKRINNSNFILCL